MAAPLPGTTLPRLSVVIPAYNEEFYLGDCLESLARQDYPGAVEVIVVDNNSTDATAEVARSRGARVVAEPQPGVCRARQAGTAAATGEIIVSTDADTTFGERWLSTIAAAFDERTVAVTGPPHFVGAPWWAHTYVAVLFGAVGLVERVTGQVFYISAANTAFRREAWTGYDVRQTQGGDELDLLRRLRRRGRVRYLPRNVAYTSSRRLERGLAYTVLVTCLYYYLLGYLVNRVSHRTAVGMAPSFRPLAARARREMVRPALGVAAAVACTVALVTAR